MERVAIYNRCSTEEENQKNALAIQAAESLEMAEELGWLVAGQYVESQSGTSINHRKEYRRMMEDMEEKKFDIVMIKSIDRLARNTKDWYLFLDCITRNGVRLYLYLERKFYVSEDALVNGIKAILAEEFSKELSQKIRNAHNRRQEKGQGLNITRNMYGWNKVAKDCYEINEEEASYIRTAFELVEAGYGYRRISNELYQKGARNKKGQRISETQWRNILRSPRIHGTMILRTTTYDFERKKRIKNPREQWIYREHALPEIVDQTYHEKMLEILDKRSTASAGEKQGIKRGVNRQQYQLSHKIICGACNHIYYRTSQNGKESKDICWQCSKYIKMGKKKAGVEGCDNIKLKERVLYKILYDHYRKQNPDFCNQDKSNLQKFLKILEAVLETPDPRDEIEKLERKLGKMQKEEELLVEKLLQGIVQDEQFLRCMDKRREVKEKLLCRIGEVQEKQGIWQDKKGRMEKIQEEIASCRLMEKALEELAAEQVESIHVSKEQRLEIRWKSSPEVSFAAYQPLNKREEEVSKKRKAVYNCIRSNPHIKMAEIMQQLNMTESTVYSYTRKLKKEGAICYKREGAGGYWVITDR